MFIYFKFIAWTFVWTFIRFLLHLVTGRTDNKNIHNVFYLACYVFLWISELFIDTNQYKIHYLIEASFYVHSLVWLRFVEKRKKDYYVLISHHIITLFLLTFSWYIDEMSVGMEVMVLHDFSDIFLYASKVVITGSFQFYVIFGCFIVFWILTRLILFNMLILDLFYRIDTTLKGILVTFLCILSVMHIYWTYMIYKTIINVLKKGKNAKDARSDDEE